MKAMTFAALAAMVLALTGCGVQAGTEAQQKAAPAVAVEESSKADEEKENAMKLTIGETLVPVTWEENASVDALRALCPVTVEMSMYGGFEQVGSLGEKLVREDKQTTTGSGDIVLYSGDQIVIFYGSNSWAYTRLGHVDLSQKEMQELLGGGDVSIRLE